MYTNWDNVTLHLAHITPHRLLLIYTTDSDIVAANHTSVSSVLSPLISCHLEYRPIIRQRCFVHQYIQDLLKIILL